MDLGSGSNSKSAGRTRQDAKHEEAGTGGTKPQASPGPMANSIGGSHTYAATSAASRQSMQPIAQSGQSRRRRHRHRMRITGPNPLGSCLEVCKRAALWAVIDTGGYLCPVHAPGCTCTCTHPHPQGHPLGSDSGLVCAAAAFPEPTRGPQQRRGTRGGTPPSQFTATACRRRQCPDQWSAP